MRTTILLSYNARGIKRLTKDIRELRGELKMVRGKYIFFVDVFQPGKAVASKPLIIDEGLLSRSVEPSLRLNPSALSPNIAGGRLLPDKKRGMIGALQREQARQRKMGGRRVIRTRAEYFKYYADEFNYFSGDIGKAINRAVTRGVRG
jgi:hypothetical protein